MIITAVCRSGATKFAYDKSVECNLKFIGEIDQIAISDFTRFDKNRYHEISVQSDLSFSGLLHVIDNHKDYVILNNQANPALFDLSDYFLTRKDIEATFYSLITLIRRQYTTLTAAQARQHMMLHSFRIGLIHTYLKEKNITPLYFEDLYPDVKTEYSIRADRDFSSLVDECMELLSKHGVV